MKNTTLNLSKKRDFATYLRNGANFLTKDNWIRHRIYNKSKWCALGALRHVNGKEPKASNYGLGYNRSLEYIVSFNDHTAKDVDEVKALLRGLATAVEHGEFIDQYTAADVAYKIVTKRNRKASA